MPTREHGSFYCPVCEKTIVFLWISQDPSSERIRMFCEDCSHLDDYSVLPKDQRIISATKASSASPAAGSLPTSSNASAPNVRARLARTSKTDASKGD